MGYDVYKQLRDKAGVRDADVARATGQRTGLFSEWKKGKYEPKSDKRQLIADYFGVSLYYLDTGIDAPEVLQLSPERMALFEPFIKRKGATALIKYINDLNDTQYQLIMQLCRELAHGSEEGGNDKDTENTQN